MISEGMKGIIQDIFDFSDSVSECKIFNEMSVQAVKKISDRLEVPSCLMYRVFRKGNEKGELWCRIIAGVPDGAHEIDWEKPIATQPHLVSVLEQRKLSTEKDLLNNSKTVHLSDIIIKKGINKMMINPLILKNKNKDKKAEPKPIGILVLDACKEKTNFSLEEEIYFFCAGETIVHLLERDEITLKEFEHNIINPNVSFGGYAKRLYDPLRELYEYAEKCKEGNCRFADQILNTAGKLLPRAAQIETEARKIDTSFMKIRQELV